MIFWVICIILTVGVAALVIAPMLKNAPVQNDTPDIAVYRDQLAEIDRDLAREALAPDEAERARTEVARRLLAANKVAARPAITASRPAVWISALVGLALAIISFAVYAQLGAPGYNDLPLKARLAASDAARDNRPSQAQLEAAMPPRPPLDTSDEAGRAMAQLREIAPARPDDQIAWEFLAREETKLGNYADAAAAQRQVIAIKGDAAVIDDHRALLDLMVFAAGGFVSPEAEALARTILAKDDQNIAARYYLGALYNQTDRPDFAVRLWREMVEIGNPDDFHIAQAASQIENAARRAGIPYKLPEVRGLSSDDITSMTDLTPEEQQAAIGEMVGRLADRLANQGGTAREWARLITAYGVLGDTDAAQAVWVEAADVFGANEDAMTVLTDAARKAGLVE